jgi:DNA polymerase-3 subunit delta'
MSAPGGSVWSTLVGQASSIDHLRRACEGASMTHAWLFVGPPGSGRSNAASAFAAGLQCEAGTGCGACGACRTVLAGTHPDVTVVRTDKLTIGVDDVRDLVRRSALTPTTARWQILLVEDADRLTDPACNALLKAIEEPNAHTVWLLCAPTTEDLLPTIRSRCRLVSLATPTLAEVSEFLVRVHAVAPPLAAYAARASQGHIGRAKALATDEATRNRRQEIVKLPARLKNLGSALNAAANILDVARDEAAAITAALDAQEKADIDAAYGVEQRGRRPREYGPALTALERMQKTRAKRRVLDVVDRSLMDLVSVYRDAVTISVGGGVGLINEEIRPEVEGVARRVPPETLLRMIDAIFVARTQMLEFNVGPQLALESMVVGLQLPSRERT